MQGEQEQEQESRYSAHRHSAMRSEVGEETRMMTRAAGLGRSSDPSDAVVNRLNRLVARQLPDFVDTSHARAPATPKLSAAITDAQENLVRRLTTSDAGDIGAVGAPALLEELRQRKTLLKQAAGTQIERATIEIVALLFQSILTEERLPDLGARLVRAAADAGAARRGQRARFLRDHRSPGAPPDRPHGAPA